MNHCDSNCFGVKPKLPSTKLSFMLKHPAWAAAINSSGLVSVPFSKRLLKLYGVLFRTLLPVVNCPVPSFPVPDQMAVALLFINVFICLLTRRGWVNFDEIG